MAYDFFVNILPPTNCNLLRSKPVHLIPLLSSVILILYTYSDPSKNRVRISYTVNSSRSQATLIINSKSGEKRKNVEMLCPSMPAVNGATTVSQQASQPVSQQIQESNSGDAYTSQTREP